MSTTHELNTDFQAAVLERSHAIPVLVDFWAEWCGPCRVLGPILEDLASRDAGRWELVKVNTEQHGDVASEYAIRSIPAVKLFHQGVEIAEFVGALPQVEIERWLQKYLPGPADGLYTEAIAQLAGGRSDEARRNLEEALRLDPEHDAARLALARVRLRDDPAAAREVLLDVGEEAPEYGSARHLLHLVGVVDWSRGGGEPEGDAASDAEALQLYREGALAFAVDDPQLALERWITVMERDRGLDDDGARRACIAVFHLLGEDHEITREMRRRFSMALAG